MANHLTPTELAVALTQYAPTEIRHLLDPAVGSGALLRPFCDSKYTVHSVTGIDKRRSVESSLYSFTSRGFGSKFHFVPADFLLWATAAEEQGSRYDCIVMNPPFAARSRKHAKILEKLDDRPLRNLPIELAFLIKCLRILEPSGRLLAILPSSAIASNSTACVRRLLLDEGAILAVQEIPQNSFKRVDGHIYLLAFQKGVQRRIYTLCNSDLFKPQKIAVSAVDLGPTLRLDYSYHKARQMSQEVYKDDQLDWCPLGSIATVRRGSVESPIKRTDVLHTIHRRGPFWSLQKAQAKGNNGMIATDADILMSRVGRNCTVTAGIIIKGKSYVVSDCVHVIKPHCCINRDRVLFALRTAVKMLHAKDLLERGTGAAYITQNCLCEFRIPLNLSKRFPAAFRQYKRAIRAHLADDMEDIETRIVRKLISRNT